MKIEVLSKSCQQNVVSFKKNHFTLDSHLNHRNLNAQNVQSEQKFLWLPMLPRIMYFMVSVLCVGNDSFPMQPSPFLSLYRRKDWMILKVICSSCSPIIMTSAFLQDLSLCFTPSIFCIFNMTISTCSQITSQLYLNISYSQKSKTTTTTKT